MAAWIHPWTVKHRSSLLSAVSITIGDHDKTNIVKHGETLICKHRSRKENNSDWPTNDC